MHNNLRLVPVTPPGRCNKAYVCSAIHQICEPRQKETRRIWRSNRALSLTCSGVRPWNRSRLLTVSSATLHRIGNGCTADAPIRATGVSSTRQSPLVRNELTRPLVGAGNPRGLSLPTETASVICLSWFPSTRCSFASARHGHSGRWISLHSYK